MAKPVTPRQRVRAGQATMVSAKGKKTIFDYYNDRGLIPVKNLFGERFENFEEFKNLIQTATTDYLNANPGVTPTKALNFTLSRLELLRKLRTKEWLDSFDQVVKASEAKKGTIYKGIPFKISKEGIVDLDKRKYMSNLPQPVYDYIADTRGEDVAKEYKKAVKKEWEEMRVRGQEFGEKTGVKVHRGHWLANKFGGAESARAGDLEIADMNVLHGADPRGDIETVKETSRSSMGWLDDFYEWDLVNNKLNVPGSELLTVEDLQGISANEVDVNQRIAQRLDEQRMGILPQNTIGNLFQSEVQEGETLEQAKFRKKEEQARVILESGRNPQTGNQATKSDIVKAKGIIKESKTQMRATPVGPRAQTSIVPNPANVTKLPSEAYSRRQEVIPRGVQQKGGKVSYQRQTVKPQDLSGNQFEMFKKGGGEAALAEGKTLAETIALGRKWSGVKPPSSSTKSKPKPKPKSTPRRNIIGAAAAGFEGTGINETHPLGGNVVDTDPLGILGGLPIRTP